MFFELIHSQSHRGRLHGRSHRSGDGYCVGASCGSSIPATTTAATATAAAATTATTASPSAAAETGE